MKAVKVDLIRRKLRRLPVFRATIPALRLLWGRNFAPLAFGIAHGTAQGGVVRVAGGFVVWIVFAHGALYLRDATHTSPRDNPQACKEV
ncbi:hypothetical protein D3C72_2227250 [compost metagenome]